jgi:DNA-3-methyladenine glycosylase I
MASTSPEASGAVPTRDGLVRRVDGTASCWWTAGDPLLERYHDLEWGRPVHDERRLFEKLCLEGFQAGLSWRTVLAKRDALRRALADFEPTALAILGPQDVERALADPGGIRHRGKVEAAVANARTLLGMHAAGVTLDRLTWRDARSTRRARAPRDRADVAATSRAGDRLAATLRGLGWRWIGPVSAHAYLQSVGVIDDHVLGCAARRTRRTDG